ncbi:hypothetical protein EVAR_38643_1 [Eumeta japonica]|uniref:Uncharacterized protein n=1 Tax=Eumeta variegata TaxID=151549 RepID=A0A4C1Y1H9_EUMVA|nr:hypothetical protein EVAR_38643_1 [Eumeta japonica]
MERHKKDVRLKDGKMIYQKDEEDQLGTEWGVEIEKAYVEDNLTNKMKIEYPSDKASDNFSKWEHVNTKSKAHRIEAPRRARMIHHGELMADESLCSRVFGSDDGWAGARDVPSVAPRNRHAV